MKRPKKDDPTCVDLLKWLRRNGLSLGALTGTDTRSLRAAAHILECYAHTRDDSLLAAFAAVVRQMQPSTREFAYHAIARFGHWDDRARVWSRAGLPLPDRIAPCEGER